MNEEPLANLQPPGIENAPLMLIAGLGERFGCDTSRAIPGQWQRFT